MTSDLGSAIPHEPADEPSVAASDAIHTQFIVRLKAGEEQAACEIVARFTSRLLGLTRRRMVGLLRRQVDPEDVVQSTFRSFFVHLDQGDLLLHDWSRLWSLLALMAMRKCGHRTDYYFAACRDVRKQVEPSPADDASKLLTNFQALAREPSPSEAVILEETIAMLLNELDDRDRRLVEMRLAGSSVAEISRALACSERTVERVLKRVGTWLEAHVSEPG